MTILVDDVVREVRRLLQDTAATKRYETPTIRQAMGPALATVRRMRPDLFLADLTTLPSTNAATLPIDVQFITPIANLTAGSMMATEDETVSAGQAANLIKLGQAQLSRNF